MSHLTVPSSVSTSLLTALNPAQRKAVETTEGPLLVLAGAGTGKTRVLTTRLAYLLQTQKAWPSEILSVTFTNKAAKEMKERIASLLGRAVEGWWLGTFHSLAARMLRHHAEKVGLTNQFTIIDTDDQLRLLKELIRVNGHDPKQLTPKHVAWCIDNWKNRALQPDEVALSDLPDQNGRLLLKLYREYQDRLRTLNACDFGDLLLHMIILLKDPNTGVQEQYRGQFRYIMVDEYQDTNTAQSLWLKLLTKAPQNNICCVGDDDQSIYSWRGAQIENILRFDQAYPKAEVIRLQTNYRSTEHILSAANSLIAKNNGRLGKDLEAHHGTGEKVKITGVWDAKEEARVVCETIEDLQRKGTALNNIAILVRAGFQMRSFEERMNAIGLPYRVIGGPRFYERKEIRDAIAYLRLIAQPRDDLAFERIINTPKRGIGGKTVQKLQQLARSNNCSLSNAIPVAIDQSMVKGKTAHKLQSLMLQCEGWRAQSAHLTPSELTGIVLDESGYTKMWQDDGSIEAKGRLENLKELVSALSEFDTLAGFLEHIALVMENAESSGGDKVTLMTLHGAKGLEFDCVFLPGWEDGLFPSQRSMDEQGVRGLEEERRLAYVGITRAKQRLYICFAANRMVYGQWTTTLPSRFLSELAPQHIEVTTAQGLTARVPFRA